MRAIKFVEPYKAEYVDTAIPEITGDEVLIKVRAVGICRSDVDAFMGRHPYRIPPVITGHEFSGVIDKVGKNVRDFKIGDRVCVEPHIGCGTCLYCKEGAYNVCKTKELIGVKDWVGCFAEYVMARPAMCTKIPDEMSFEEGALLEPLAVGVHAVELADMSEGANVAVQGCGTIGMLTLGAVLTKKPKNIIISDISPVKRNLAKELGANYLVDPAADDLGKVVMDVTGNYGVDYLFVTVPVAPVLQQSLTLVRKRGKLCIVALFDKPIELDVAQIQLNERTVIGSCMYTREDYEIALNYYTAGTLDFKKLITKRISFDEAASHVERLAKGELGDEIKIIAVL